MVEPVLNLKRAMVIALAQESATNNSTDLGGSRRIHSSTFSHQRKEI